MAIQMTRAEYEQKYGVKPVVSSTPVTQVSAQPKIQMTRAEYEAKYGVKPIVNTTTGPTIEQQRQERRDQGLPVSQNPNRVEPTFGGEIVRGIVKPAAILATTAISPFSAFAKTKEAEDKINEPFSGDYLGSVTRLKGPTEGGGMKDFGRALGVGLDIGSNFAGGSAVGTIGKGTVGALTKEVAKETAKQYAKRLAIEGAITGGGQSLGSSLANGNTLGDTIQNTVAGTLGGAVLAPVAGLGFKGLGAGTRGVINKISPTDDYLKSSFDDNIKDIFKNTTGDAGVVDDTAFRAQKGLEQLVEQSKKKLNVVDSESPIGKTKNKPLDIQTATPNEIINGVYNMDKRIAGIARGSSELASKQGITLDTSDAKALVTQAINNGDIPKATGVRLYQQINNLGNDPLKIHDWVQEVNVKYGNRFNNGTIDDTATSKLANGIAQKFRNSLDTVVDRTGYAEAYANNQALKKALVQIAKKANKNVSFGDIGTEAGLDAAIAMITGNPEYMLRTVGSGIFKGILSKIRNQSGFNSFKKAANISSKLGTKTKLPKFGIKDSYNSM